MFLSTRVVYTFHIYQQRQVHVPKPDNLPQIKIFQKKLYKALAEKDIHIYAADVSHDAETGRFNYILTIELPAEMAEEDLVAEYTGSRISPTNH